MLPWPSSNGQLLAPSTFPNAAAANAMAMAVFEAQQMPKQQLLPRAQLFCRTTQTAGISPTGTTKSESPTFLHSAKLNTVTFGQREAKKTVSEEMHPPPGFWRQLADCPPPQQTAATYPLGSTAAAAGGVHNNSNNSSPSNNPNSGQQQRFSLLTVPPAQQFYAAQSQLIWMANLFSQAAISGDHFVGNQLGQQHVMHAFGEQQQWHHPPFCQADIRTPEKLALNEIPQRMPPTLEELPKQLTPNQQMELQTMPVLTVEQQRTSQSQSPLDELEQQQRQLLFLHALSPTPPAFRLQPAAQTSSTQTAAVFSTHSEQPNPQPSSPSPTNCSMVVCRIRQNSTSHRHQARSEEATTPNATTSPTAFLLKPPELKREEQEVAIEEMGNGSSHQDEEEEDEEETGFAKMPKLEPETMMDVGEFVEGEDEEMEPTNDDSVQLFTPFDNQENTDLGDPIILSRSGVPKAFTSVSRREAAANARGKQCCSPSSINLMPQLESNAIDVCHQQKSATETAPLLPPLPPSLLFREKQTSKEKNESKGCQTVVEQQIGGHSTTSSSSSSRTSTDSNPSSSGFSTSSGISSADSACLESPHEEDEEDDDEEGKMERNKSNLENKGEVQQWKRKRRRKAPVLNARRKCLKKLEKEEKVKRGKHQNASVLEDVEDTDEPKAKRQKTTLKLKPNNSAITKSPTKNDLKQKQPKGKKGSAKAIPPVRLASNWCPVGQGSSQRPHPEASEERTCFQAIRHKKADVVVRTGDCVLINSEEDEEDIYVGRVLAIHHEPDRRALLLTLLWFYTTRQLPVRPADAKLLDQRELFASRHLDTVNADSVQGVAHVLTFAEYCRYRAQLAINKQPERRKPLQCSRPWPRVEHDYARREFLPNANTAADMVFFCRGVFSIRTKRVSSLGMQQNKKSSRGLRPCRKTAN